MKLIAQSERIYLRELNTSDALSFYNLNIDFEVLKYTGDEPFKDIEDVKIFLKKYVKQYENYKMGRWAICLNNTHKMIGWCGLKYHPKEKLADIGYRLLKTQWNKGYATEATQLALEYGFNKLNLKEIIAHVHEKNNASHKVILKAGLKYYKTIIYDNKPARFYTITKLQYLNKLGD
jgi:ribosomal-protein-alanine N-acetyltransferase